MKHGKKTVGGRVLSSVGLGCGRLGSVTSGQTPADMLALIAGARDLGVNVFDTSNIYGQGRSERTLGDALRGATDVCIITKAGYYYPLAQRVLSPLRKPVAALLKRSSAAQGGVRAVRALGLPQDFRRERLEASLQASLKRLRREQTDAFLLHSPALAHLQDGAVLDGLVEIKRRGLAGLVGVSCDGLDVLEHVCRDPRVDVIEAPFGMSRRGMEAALEVAAARGAMIIAREVLSAEAPARPPSPREAVAFCVNHPSVDVTLVGTTRLAHLREATEAAI